MKDKVLKIFKYGVRQYVVIVVISCNNMRCLAINKKTNRNVITYKQKHRVY